MSTCISLQGEFSSHAPGAEGGDRFICQACGVFDEEAALKRIAELEAALKPKRAVAPEAAPKTPCPDGFHWIGQSFRHCDQCGLPAWEHAGWAELPKGGGPFDTRPLVLTPFKPGEAELLVAAADLIRDLAAKATPGPWETIQDTGGIWREASPERSVRTSPGYLGSMDAAADARWIAALSPALAEPMPRPTVHPVDQFLTPALDEHMPAVLAALDQAVADTLTQVSQQQVVHTAPGSMVEDIRRACELVGDVQPPEPVKLTREQRDTLRAASYPTPNAIGYWQDGALGELTGVPIELVDTVEESTPYLLREQQMRQRFREAMRNVARFPPARSAPDEPPDTNPQVGENSRRSEAGERGWLRRALDVLYGRQP